MQTLVGEVQDKKHAIRKYKARNERAEFSKRLKTCLENAGYEPDSYTSVAREYNNRDGASEVTIHAVRKWLVGEAIPTQSKLRVIAAWLGVSVSWLRFGDGDPPSVIQPRTSGHTKKALLLLARLQALDENDYRLVSDLVRRLSSK